MFPRIVYIMKGAWSRIEQLCCNIPMNSLNPLCCRKRTPTQCISSSHGGRSCWCCRCKSGMHPTFILNCTCILAWKQYQSGACNRCN
ncbi:hypothetical protein ANCCAN_17496 [Ancylostoma caninum]|uniref:Uncharacterized protein n=1 Tax=Ancylostoma caninum TaxID=29170 RepID=A0A368G0W2_ANCCA|nr:hypothetical protein ANCCAN_17496 [Ancylostoma caninum]